MRAEEMTEKFSEFLAIIKTKLTYFQKHCGFFLRNMDLYHVWFQKKTRINAIARNNGHKFTVRDKLINRYVITLNWQVWE